MDKQFRYQTDADLKPKAVKATKMFVERMGFDVIEIGFQTIAGGIDVIARDECGTIHLVWVRAQKFGLAEPVADYGELRKFFEQRAAAWLEAHPEHVDVFIEFDVADLGIVGENRALLRYQHNVLSSPCACDELRARGEMHAASLPCDSGGGTEADDATDADEDAA